MGLPSGRIASISRGGEMAVLIGTGGDTLARVPLAGGAPRELLERGVTNVDPPAAGAPLGDGSEGILEGYAALIRPDGTQQQVTSLRSDCNAETAMVLALDAMLNQDRARSGEIASNLLDYVFGPEMQSMGRLDPNHPAFGLTAWGAIQPAWQVANYGDDDARVMLSTAIASAALKTDRWDEHLLRALYANLRTTGKLGFRTDRIDIGPLEAKGWRAFHDASPVNPALNFEAYLWACYLWAYRQTNDQEFLDTARLGIRKTMQVYPAGWRWGVGGNGGSAECTRGLFHRIVAAASTLPRMMALNWNRSSRRVGKPLMSSRLSRTPRRRNFCSALRIRPTTWTALSPATALRKNANSGRGSPST